MFTGLVAGRGFVHDVRPEGVDDSSAQRKVANGNAPDGKRNESPATIAALRLTIQVPDGFGPAGSLGESVAIDGCCLTAVAIDGNRWSFQAGSETLSKTNLGRLAGRRGREPRTGASR